MDLINGFFNAVFGALLAPFDAWPALLTLVVWSAVIGVVMAVVFRYTSNQRALKAVADQSRANLLAIKEQRLAAERELHEAEASLPQLVERARRAGVTPGVLREYWDGE